MRIVSAEINLSSTYTQVVREESSQRVQAWNGQRPDAAQNVPRLDSWQRSTPAGDDGFSRMLEQAAKKQSAQINPGEPPSDPELEKILILLERMFGDTSARASALRLKSIGQQFQHSQTQISSSHQSQVAQTTNSQPAAGWGMIAESNYRLTEMQSASLVADGTFTLEDGSSFAFHLDWSQTITRVEQSSTRVAMGDATLSDPLNFDLTGNGFSFLPGSSLFDLDNDGVMQHIPRPQPGNAWLVDDRNGDDQVDHDELFGATTGQAFRELASRDDDHNGWIDAGDRAFAGLRLWDGVRGLTPLQQAGIAAIATLSVPMPFRHRDDQGGLLALARRAGMYLRDDGRTGAVAQVDLVT